jgi:hypothetical protein
MFFFSLMSEEQDIVPPVASVQPVVFTSVNFAIVAPVPVPLTSSGAPGAVVPMPTLPLK